MGTVPPPLVTLSDLWFQAGRPSLAPLDHYPSPGSSGPQFSHLQSGNDAICLASWVLLDRENMLQVTEVPSRLQGNLQTKKHNQTHL